jgi:transcriptional regulator with XRE-family HTH domain
MKEILGMSMRLAGNKLKLAIADAGMSHAEFARRMSTSPQQVSNWIGRGTTDASYDLVCRMKAVLACGDSELMVTVRD